MLSAGAIDHGVRLGRLGEGNARADQWLDCELPVSSSSIAVCSTRFRSHSG